MAMSPDLRRENSPSSSLANALFLLSKVPPATAAPVAKLLRKNDLRSFFWITLLFCFICFPEPVERVLCARFQFVIFRQEKRLRRVKYLYFVDTVMPPTNTVTVSHTIGADPFAPTIGAAKG